jgi:hypothetical protein
VALSKGGIGSGKKTILGDGRKSFGITAFEATDVDEVLLVFVAFTVNV